MERNNNLSFENRLGNMNVQLLLNVFIYFLFNINIAKAENKENVILLIKDFMEYYEHPNKIYTYTCWNKGTHTIF